MKSKRRQLLKYAASIGGFSVIPRLGTAMAATSGQEMDFGDGELLSLSDGHLSLPLGMILPDTIEAADRETFISEHNLGSGVLKPDCNLTLWRQGSRQVLFDVGAGSQFQVGGGMLADTMDEIGIDPADITDIIFTHGHPDHLWGVIDDFNEIAFPQAHFHMPRLEWNYWRNDNTLSRTAEARRSFVVGAQSRLTMIEERIRLFDFGAEVLPGIEAVDTRGHTPGHCSFALHQGNDSILVIGDALANATISFEKPRWPSGSDQDQQQGIDTRLSLLDRLSLDKNLVLGFHLPSPGIGWVEKQDKAYRFVPSV